MARFQSESDFWGVYGGFHDGRLARLTIGDTRGDFPVPAFVITLEDVDRDTSFRSQVLQNDPTPGHGHILRDFNLKEVDGNGEMIVDLLLLHTWDIDHITVVSRWQGREFGGVYHRV